MSMGKWFLGSAILLASGSYISAIAAPATQPSDAKPMHHRGLVEPWSLLKTLTPDQTAQIEKLHADALEQTKKIDAKENDDIMALLTPAQVAELKSAKEKLAAERKEHSSKKKMATTEPMK